MRSRRKSSQTGHTLLEVMFASVVLSIFVLAMGSVWHTARTNADALVVRQKAIFVLNSEMERLSALYNRTTFGVLGPVSTNGYTPTNILPATRLSYPLPLLSYVAQPFTTMSLATFNASDFNIWLHDSGSGLYAYVWIDRGRGVAGRLSWTTSNIIPAVCTAPGSCSCMGFSGLLSDNCRNLNLYLEYPYRIASDGTVTTQGQLQTLSLKTMVGHGETIDLVAWLLALTGGLGGILGLGL